MANQLDAIAIIENFAGYLPTISYFISACAVALGIFLCMRAFMGWHAMADPSGKWNGKTPPTHMGLAITLLVGALLTSQDFLIWMLGNTMFGATYGGQVANSDAFSFHTQGMGSETLAAYTAIMQFFAVVGKIAVFRGFYILWERGSGRNQQTSTWKAVWHMIGGAGLVFMDDSLRLISGFVGFDLVGTVFLK